MHHKLRIKPNGKIFVSRLSAQIFFTSNIHIACWYCMSIYESDSVSTDIHYQRTQIQIKATKTLSEHFLALSDCPQLLFHWVHSKCGWSRTSITGYKEWKVLFNYYPLWPLIPTPNQCFFGSAEFTCPPSWFLNLCSPSVSVKSSHLIQSPSPSPVCFFLLGYWY